MSQEPAFWDASALVPLCVHEITSRQAQSQLRHSMPVVWWASPVEVHSAIARLHRRGKLKDVHKKGALSRLEMLSQGWREILPSDPLRELSTQLLETYELRAADSLQLAAALTWCQQRPAGRTFICADQRLSKKAAAAGFAVVELS
jgi:predicted nucleic acid-binding protein